METNEIILEADKTYLVKDLKTNKILTCEILEATQCCIKYSIEDDVLKPSSSIFDIFKDFYTKDQWIEKEEFITKYKILEEYKG